MDEWGGQPMDEWGGRRMDERLLDGRAVMALMSLVSVLEPCWVERLSTSEELAPHGRHRRLEIADLR